jgi:hypothetical protein
VESAGAGRYRIFDYVNNYPGEESSSTSMSAPLDGAMTPPY